MEDENELVHSGDASVSSSSSAILRPNPGAVASTNSLSMGSILKAVNSGDVNCVKQIIKRHGSRKVINTFLHLAVYREKVEILEYLLTLPIIDINSRTNKGKTPLFISVQLGFAYIALKLIEAGADVTIPNRHNVTPLHKAVTNSLFELARILIEKGADVNAVNTSGYTPLHKAVQYENFEILCMLLYHGADTSYKTLQGMTPFMFALNNSVSKEIQEELLRYEVDFNMESCDGRPLLFFAINNNSPLIIDIINMGADVNYNVGGKTVLDMILHSKRPELVYHILPLVDMDNVLQGNSSILSSVINCPYPSSDWLYVVFSLITCDKAQEFVEQFLQVNYYCTFFAVFALMFHSRNIPEKELVTFIDICLCLGVDVYYGDIHKVYELYGHNEALSRLLLAEIKDLNSVKDLSFPILFCDVKTNITDLINKLPLQYYLDSEVDKVLDFCTPNQKFKDLFYIMNDVPVENELIRKRKQRFNNRTVPSLIEMSRNKTRESICAKYKVTSSHEFYCRLRKLEIPPGIKDIIIWKCPIYST